MQTWFPWAARPSSARAFSLNPPSPARSLAPCACLTLKEPAMSLPRPSLDPELNAKLSAFPLGIHLNAEILTQMRQYAVPAETYLEGRSVQRRDRSVQSLDGFDLPISVFHPKLPAVNAPASTGCMAA
ncbi:MAG: Alpha/beta hydrolase fold-3 domain protein, partial [Devosia sp.]|nr:Alpha/beta hydrolase fold-3 domain protein [Devosia sp.]